MLNKKQQREFVALFSDLDYELNDMGWKGDETTLINDMLFNHFGLSVEDDGQLQMLTDCILKPNMLKAAATTVNIL
jgi:hypothetical protein